MCHGTATSFPSPEVEEEPVEPNELEFLDERGLVELVFPAPVVSLEVELCCELIPVEPDEPLDPREIKAKSTRPEAGLIITSETVPIDSLPDEPLICALINLLARTS